MNTLTKLSLAHALAENFKVYPDNYPMQAASNGISPTEDAISALVTWVENEYENSDNPEKGYIEDWFEVAAATFYRYFELRDGDFDESGATWDYLKKEIDNLRTY